MKPSRAALWAVGLLATGGLVSGCGARTPERAFEKAAKQEVRLEETIGRERKSAAPDVEIIEASESKIRAAWQSVIDRWPESAQAPQAQYRLLLRDLASAEDARTRLKVVEDFLADHPEHEKKKDLLWQKAEIQRDELQDRMGAIATLKKIEEEFAEDPIAARAAMGVAQLYESIREFNAAAGAYKHVADTYPDAPEAEQATMRRAILLEEKLNRPREAAKAFREVARSSPGSPTGRRAERRFRQLMGEISQSDQDDYYRGHYGALERNIYEVTKAEFNSPTRKRIREQGFDIDRYDLSIQLDPAESKLIADVRIRGALEKPLEGPLLLQLNPAFEIERIAPGEEGTTTTLNFSQRGPYVEIVFPDQGEAPAMELDFRIAYSGKVGSWFGDSLGEAGGALHAESKWYPQTDFGDLYTQRLSVALPADYDVVAQGSAHTAADAGSNEPRVVEFIQEDPTQFITLLVGRYERMKMQGPRGLPIVVTLQKEHADRAGQLGEDLREIVEFFEDVFGPYPFEKLELVEAIEFPGALSAPSLVLIGSDVLAAGEVRMTLLAHEVAHQWCGLATNLDLQEGSIAWLSESFATYGDALFLEHTEGAEAHAERIATMAGFYLANLEHMTDQTIGETFWPTPAYRSVINEKGPLALRRLRRELGEESFSATFRQYFESNRFKVVRVSDFAQAASKAAGEPMNWFFDQALGRTGYPRVEIQSAAVRSSGENWKLDLELVQPAPGYRMRLDLAIESLDGGSETASFLLEGEVTRVELDRSTRPTKILLDPDAWSLLDRRPEVTQQTVYAD